MRSLSKIFKTTIDKNLPDRLQEEAEFIHKHIVNIINLFFGKAMYRMLIFKRMKAT